MAVKLYRLKRAGKTIIPVTVTDAVVDLDSMKLLSTLLKELANRLDVLEDQPGILWG
jgi:hypothetical protein